MVLTFDHPEPGTLDMNQVEELHNHLLATSGLYRYCHENKLVGWLIKLQLAEVERRMALKGN